MKTISMTELARRLGIQAHQVHYLIKSGRIPAGIKGNKFRYYSEEQVQGIERWYRDYMKLDAGCCNETK